MPRCHPLARACAVTAVASCVRRLFPIGLNGQTDYRAGPDDEVRAAKAVCLGNVEAPGEATALAGHAPVQRRPDRPAVLSYRGSNPHRPKNPQEKVLRAAAKMFFVKMLFAEEFLRVAAAGDQARDQARLQYIRAP
jgi:hypothetical protein